VASCCERGDELSVSIKGGEFLDNLCVLLVSQEGRLFMELLLRKSTSVGWIKKRIYEVNKRTSWDVIFIRQKGIL
jgi:hypothetical protein